MSKFEDFEKILKASAEVRSRADKAYKKLGEDVAQAHTSYFQSMIELGKEQGFEFTIDEVSAQFQKRADELTDAQLEAVAGGAIALQEAQLAEQPLVQTDPTLQSAPTFTPRLPGIGPYAGT